MDSTAQLKRDLWVMKEIMDASPRGITFNELASKWQNSYLNDLKGTLCDRTFLRIKKTLESTFDIEIKCDRKDESRYKIPSENMEPGGTTLFSLLMKDKKKGSTDKDQTNDSSLKSILSLLVSRNPIPEKDAMVLTDIYKGLRQIPIEIQKEFKLLVRDGKVSRADSEEPDRYYKPDYLDVWNAERYQKNGLWLSLGFLENEIRFYVVTELNDPEVIARISTELDMDEGIRYRGGWWWFEPKDKDLFCLKYEIRPEMSEIISRTEKLLEIIAKFEK